MYHTSLSVFLWLVEQDWCETILEPMWGSTSLGRGGVFSDLKEQFHGGRTLGCQWGNLVDGSFSSKSWYFVCSHRRWSDLLCSRLCLHDHPHQTLEKETLQYTPQLVKTFCERDHESGILETNSFLGSCSMTFDSKSHLVAPALSTGYPVIQEDARRRLRLDNTKPLTWPVRKSEKQPEPRCLACT